MKENYCVKYSESAYMCTTPERWDNCNHSICTENKGCKYSSKKWKDETTLYCHNKKAQKTAKELSI